MKRILILLLGLSAVFTACQAPNYVAPAVDPDPVDEAVEVVEEVVEVAEAVLPTQTPQPLAPSPQPPTVEPEPFKSSLPVMFEAKPWLNDTWINTPNNDPITLEALEGKVVLLTFWTYS